FAADTLHTTHGRPVAFATGVKLGLPDQRVMVVSGDGDLTAIGGNHLIHAARRNIDLTVVLINNGIYGMTGGQAAPTTPRGTATVTSPYGNMEHSFDIAPMIAAAGAAYVARWTTHHPRQLTKAIRKGIAKKGFSLIEVISQCPVQYGRVSKLGGAVEMLMHYKANSLRIDKARKSTAADLEGKIIVGEFADIEKPELSAECGRLIRSMREGRS
ncbi:MAG TPA: thiamine pyrophosphate-dependent enzyme, partial [Desulfosarcina sp.]|nr:thiamine pyrophosphate-dependent enzyme [Desulfosarcina sp.]